MASFMLVVTYKSKINIQFLKTRSSCDYCNTKLNFFDLIPIISYLILNGKCRYCKTKISESVFYGEVLLGVTYLLPIISDMNPDFLIYYYTCVTFLIPLSLIDIEKLIIPNHIIFLLLITGCALITINYIDMFIKISLIILVILIYPVMQSYVGFGDIKLLATLFIIFPYNLFLLILLFTFLIGGLVVISLELFLRDNSSKYPLVPFITTSTIIVLLRYSDLYKIFGGIL